MDIQDLKYFCAVASEGSVSRAAQKLHYAQSNLSTKMMQLERQVGCSLFYRTNRGVTLTPKGELLLNYAWNLIHLEEETMAALQEKGEAQGVLKIGSMESTIVSRLPGLLARFYQENPQVAIQVEGGNTEALLQQVLAHQLDGAFVAGPVRHPELLVKPVTTEQLCLIAAKSFASMESRVLLSQPMLVFPQGCSYRKILERWLQQEGIAAGRIYEFNTLSAIFASVIAGLGVALFPESCVRQYSQHHLLTLIEVPSPYALVSTVFVYRKDRFLSAAMNRFLQQL